MDMWRIMPLFIAHRSLFKEHIHETTYCCRSRPASHNPLSPGRDRRHPDCDR
jgi:hypothetical protein